MTARQGVEGRGRLGAGQVEGGDASARGEQRLDPDRAEPAARTGHDCGVVIEAERVVYERASSPLGLLRTSNDRKSSACRALSVTRPRTFSSSYGGMPPPGDFIVMSSGPTTWPLGRSRATTRLLPILII